MLPANSSLKQRLAALSLSSTSPSTPDHRHGLRPPTNASTPTAPTTLFNRRKILNVTPWIKRQQNQSAYIAAVEDEKVQQVMMRLIFQAGVDFETRPMVIMSASALPDPRDINYDLLLSRILSYLNLYVESDYTVVFLAAGGRHTPAWNWVWKAYRSLGRKYRKNLKRMYIVHSSMFSKMLFSLAGAIISPKFFRKIEYIQTLSQLAQHVPLTQIDIPPIVYQENLKYEDKITLPVPQRSSMFGVPLEELMGIDGEKGSVPRIVRDCIQYLREIGMEEEGLFRRSPSSVMLRAAQEAYDRGNVVSLESFGDPNLAAVLLKKYLRDLPEAVFPDSLYPIIRRCPPPLFGAANANDITSVTYVRDVLLPELVPCVYILLSHILQLMHEVSLRSRINRMDAHNLAIVLCPNLVKGSNPARDVMMCAVPGGPSLFSTGHSMGQPSPLASNAAVSTGGSADEGQATLGWVIKLCIERYYEVFDEVRDRSEAVDPQRVFRGRAMMNEEPNYQDAAGLSADDGGEIQHDDDEDIDDAMLVMPIGPSHSGNGSLLTGEGAPIARGGGSGTGPTLGPPSAWRSKAQRGNIPISNSSSGLSSITGSVGLAPNVRSMYPTLSKIQGPPSFNSSPAPNHLGSSYSSISKSRSLVSVENGIGMMGIGSLRGSIAIGRGTQRNNGKSAGAGVEAVGVTAEGFFAPPPGAGSGV